MNKRGELTREQKKEKRINVLKWIEAIGSLVGCTCIILAFGICGSIDIDAIGLNAGMAWLLVLLLVGGFFVKLGNDSANRLREEGVDD